MLTNTKFIILVAVILVAAIGIAIAVIESNRDPTPEEAARQTVEFIGAMLDENEKLRLKIAREQIVHIEFGYMWYRVDKENYWGPKPTVAELKQGRKPDGDPLIPGSIIDPWGNPYTIAVSGPEPLDYTIESMGPDGKPRTRDDIRRHPLDGFLGG